MDVLCNITVALADCIEISISDIIESATLSCAGKQSEKRNSVTTFPWQADVQPSPGK